MKIYLEKALFINRAPFENLELDFNENEIAVLSAVNGRGKTTIISHIVDAIHEMARPNFHNEFKNKSTDFYRVSSAIYNLNQGEPSFVYFRFKLDNDEFIDYVDVQGNCDEIRYNKAISLNNKVNFSSLKNSLDLSGGVKYVSQENNGKTIKEIFSDNVLTYFPSYRYEQPGYINKPYEIKLDFVKKSEFSGNLRNPIEVVSGLDQLINWILDIILDNQYLNVGVNDIRQAILFTPQSVNKDKFDFSSYVHTLINNSVAIKSELQRNLSLILNGSLKSKHSNSLRFGIGNRSVGGTRVQIINVIDNTQVYPSIFNISSGEAAVLCLFGEVLRHADKLKNDISLSEITGIVLIDEVDKHLHIKLQKEVLPTLFDLFPSIQFIVSSHSPFLSMGLAENPRTLARTRIIDLDNFGISKDPTTNELYQEVYSMMIGENEKYAELYKSLKQEIEKDSKPLIVAEGKTDVQHLKKAREKLDINDLDIDYFEIPEKGWGSSKLKGLLENICKLPNKRKVIGIFDRDEPEILKFIESNQQSFKDYGNNVFAFCIPAPVGKENYTNISIEFYYSDKDLKKTSEGKCLYFDNELNFDSKHQIKSRIDSPVDDFSKKIQDVNIGSLNWIHSKSRFAELVESNSEFVGDFYFDNFKCIFDKIKSIVNK